VAEVFLFLSCEWEEKIFYKSKVEEKGEYGHLLLASEITPNLRPVGWEPNGGNYHLGC
jgi:hypothetical protein